MQVTTEQHDELVSILTEARQEAYNTLMADAERHYNEFIFKPDFVGQTIYQKYETFGGNEVEIIKKVDRGLEILRLIETE